MIFSPLFYPHFCSPTVLFIFYIPFFFPLLLSFLPEVSFFPSFFISLALFSHFLDTRLIFSLTIYPLWLLFYLQKTPPLTLQEYISMWVDGNMLGVEMNRKSDYIIKLSENSSILGVFWKWQMEMKFVRHFWRHFEGPKPHSQSHSNFPLKLCTRLMSVKLDL